MRKLSDNEYAVALEAKLQEEVQEYLESREPEELADILEVIHAIAKELGTDMSAVEHLRLKKLEKRGGFEQKLALEL